MMDKQRLFVSTPLLSPLAVNTIAVAPCCRSLLSLPAVAPCCRSLLSLSTVALCCRSLLSLSAVAPCCRSLLSAPLLSLPAVNTIAVAPCCQHHVWRRIGCSVPKQEGVCRATVVVSVREIRRVSQASHCVQRQHRWSIGIVRTATVWRVGVHALHLSVGSDIMTHATKQ